MKDSIFIGLDVHKATISVAVADGERGGEVRDWGKLPNRPDRVRKLAEQLGAKGQQLYFSRLFHKLVYLAPRLDPFPRPHAVPPGRVIPARRMPTARTMKATDRPA